MRTAVRLTSALAVCLLLCAGCFASKETRDGANELEDAIGTPSWAESVRVSTSVSGLSDDEVLTFVVLRDDATAAQIADFVLDHPDRVEDAGLELGFGDLEFVSTKGATLTVPAADATDAEAVRAAVARWQKVVPLLAIGSTAELGRDTGGVSYAGWLTEGGPPSLMSLFDLLRGDDQLAASTDAWSISAGGDGDLGMALRSYTLPTRSEVETLTDLAAALRRLPESVRATGLSLERLEDRTIVDQTLVLPDDVTPDNITPANYGGQLWPALSAQLRAVAGIAGRWTYVVEWAPTDTPESTTTLVSLLDDQQPIDNGDPASLWSKKARDYVDGL